MEPPEPELVIVFGTILLCIFLMTVYGITKQILRYKSRQRDEEKEPAGVGLTELEEVIRRSVLEASRPIALRMDQLDERMSHLAELLESADPDLLPESRSPRIPGLLEGLDEPPAERAKAARSRARQR
jgi:hypothetical protein